jgi:putative endonuclease
MDVDRRVAAHNAGRAARYTRSRRPVKLVYAEKRASRAMAMKREAAIKKMSRARKLRLIRDI